MKKTILSKGFSFIISIVLILFGVSFTINLALNKKYAVDEIPYTHSKKALEGIQEIVQRDYVSMIYINAAYTIAIIILLVLLIRKRKMQTPN